jgi:hypothetical protein
MDGKLVTGIGLLLIPGALIGVTVAWFASNPVSIFAMIALMIIGGFYLLTYRDAFG